MKKWYQSRSLWFNALLVLVFTVQSIGEVYIEYAPITGIIAGVGNFILRLNTNQGVALK